MVNRDSQVFVWKYLLHFFIMDKNRNFVRVRWWAKYNLFPFLCVNLKSVIITQPLHSQLIAAACGCLSYFTEILEKCIDKYVLIYWDDADHIFVSWLYCWPKHYLLCWYWIFFISVVSLCLQCRSSLFVLFLYCF